MKSGEKAGFVMAHILLNRRRTLLGFGAAVLAAARPHLAIAELFGFDELYGKFSPLGLEFSEKTRCLHGRSVEMNGFMAPPLKTEISMSICPFCSSDADWPDNIVVVYLDKKQTLCTAFPDNQCCRNTGYQFIGGMRKTTFVNLVTGLHKPRSGTVRWGDTDFYTLSERRRDQWCDLNIGLVNTGFHLFPGLSAVENVLLSPRLGVGVRAADYQRAACFLVQVQVQGISRDIRHISRGEVQRIAIALALLRRPSVLIALATAFGVIVTLGERAVRLGSARAVDHFDIVIGAAGSPVQLLLSFVFLQPAALPLVSGTVLEKLQQDKTRCLCGSPWFRRQLS